MEQPIRGVLNFGYIKSSGGSTDYRELENKPKINNIELVGNVTLENLGVQRKGNYALKTEIPTIPTEISSFTNDVGYLTDVPSGYATEEYVNNIISSSIISVLEDEY